MVKTAREAYSLCCTRLGKTDGNLLFCGVTGMSLSEVLTHPDRHVSTDFEPLFARLAQGEPIQYVVGETEFMSLPFYVTPAVLIPRQDTETLVEFALQQIQTANAPKGLDLCTGSGCIAIALATHGKAQMTALDISANALEIARKNAERNGADIQFVQGDALCYDALQNLDFVLSNPPYIESSVVDSLEKKVKDFEPRLALDGGADGLDFYQKIAQNSYKMLKKDGFLAVEIGYNQADAVSAIFHRIYKNSCVIQDLCGNNRVVYAVKKGNV